MSPTAVAALNRRMRSKPPSVASSRRSNDLTVVGANGYGNGKFSPKPRCPSHAAGERTVKKLRLSKALTIPDGTTVSEACKMMAVRRVDAVLLTDANDLLSGILTDKVVCSFS